MKTRRLLSACVGLLLGATGVGVGMAAPSKGATGAVITTITVSVPATTVTVSLPFATTTVKTPATTLTATATTPTPSSVRSTTVTPVLTTPSVRSSTTGVVVPVRRTAAPTTTHVGGGSPTRTVAGGAAAGAAANQTSAPSTSAGSSGVQSSSPSPSPSTPSAPGPTSRGSTMTSHKNTATIALTRGSGRAGFVTLLIRLTQRGALHIALVGPSPSCVIARTVVRHGRAGLNRFRLGPSAVRGLTPGAYLVRIPVRGRPQPLRSAVTITPRRNVVPNRRRSAIDRVCVRAAMTPFAVGASAHGGPSAPYRPPAEPAHSTGGHRLDLIPRSIRNALRGATTSIGHAAAAAASSTFLLLVFCALVLAGAVFLVYPLARHLHQRHIRRYG